MSKQFSEQIFGKGSSNILRDALHFVSVGVKIPKTSATADANGNLKVLAGTVVSAAGLVVADATAFGIVLEDWNFDNVPAGGVEIVPVVIHGTVIKANLPVQVNALSIMPGIVLV